jgi:hypothetical protein
MRDAIKTAMNLQGISSHGEMPEKRKIQAWFSGYGHT